MGKHHRHDTPTPMGIGDQGDNYSEQKQLNKRERRKRRKLEKAMVASSLKGEPKIQGEIKEKTTFDQNKHRCPPDAAGIEEPEPQGRPTPCPRELKYPELAPINTHWFQSLSAAEIIHPVIPLYTLSTTHIAASFPKPKRRREIPASLKQSDCYLCKTFDRPCHTVDKSMREMVLDAGRIKATAHLIHGIAQHIERATDEFCMEAVSRDTAAPRHSRRQSWSWNAEFGSVGQTPGAVVYNPNGCFG